MDTKKWWLSKGLWGGIVGLIAMVLMVFKVVDISVEEQATLVDSIVAIVTMISGLVGIILAIYGRLTAKKTLTT